MDFKLISEKRFEVSFVPRVQSLSAVPELNESAVPKQTRQSPTKMCVCVCVQLAHIGCRLTADAVNGLVCGTGCCWRQLLKLIFKRMHAIRIRYPAVAMSKEIIRLSVGGEVVVVTASLLRRAPPRLQLLLQQTPDMSGLIQMDRDYTYFAPLLHYLRTGHVAVDPGVSPHGVAAEAA